MTAKFNDKGQFKEFQGWARMGAKIRAFTIHEVKAPKIGDVQPQRVLAEIEYSVQGMPTYLRKEWEELQKHDVLQLVFLQPTLPVLYLHHLHNLHNINTQTMFTRPTPLTPPTSPTHHLPT